MGGPTAVLRESTTAKTGQGRIPRAQSPEPDLRAEQLKGAGIPGKGHRAF